MSPVSNETVLEQMQWRYATKVFDPARKISPEQWNTLEQALVLTPSSFGLQPWRFVVITDQPTKERLVPLSYGQSQPGLCSHMVVFAIRKNFSEADIDKFVARTADIRGVPIEALAGFRKSMVRSLITPPPNLDINEWATRQIYIALGNFMTTAAMMGIDTCPMEGIDPVKYDDVLNLTSQGFATSVACAAGFRAENCKYATLPKVRFHPDDVIVRI